MSGRTTRTSTRSHSRSQSRSERRPLSDKDTNAGENAKSGRVKKLVTRTFHSKSPNLKEERLRRGSRRRSRQEANLDSARKDSETQCSQRRIESKKSERKTVSPHSTSESEGEDWAFSSSEGEYDDEPSDDDAQDENKFALGEMSESLNSLSFKKEGNKCARARRTPRILQSKSPSAKVGKPDLQKTPKRKSTAINKAKPKRKATYRVFQQNDGVQKKKKKQRLKRVEFSAQQKDELERLRALYRQVDDFNLNVSPLKK